MLWVAAAVVSAPAAHKTTTKSPAEGDVLDPPVSVPLSDCVVVEVEPALPPCTPPTYEMAMVLSCFRVMPS